MSVITIQSSTAKADVIRGDITRPRSGVWSADLVIDQPNGKGFEPGTRVQIAGPNSYALTGTVDPARTGDFLDAVHVRVHGGAGGMSNESTARSFVQPGAYIRDVLNALNVDSGERLSTTIDVSLLATNLAAWSIIGGNSVGRNLRALLDITNEQNGTDNDWRILADGTLWIGSESWPQASGTYEIMEYSPTDASYELGVDAPFVVPGTTLPNIGKVARVRDSIIDGELRSRVWIEIPGVDRSTAYAAQAMARQALPGVDYHALYVCQMVTQSADLLTVDITPVGARNKAMIGGLQRVPVRFGVGFKAQLAPGASVLLGWDGGNPEGPYVCCGLSSNTVLKWIIEADQMAIDGGSKLTLDATQVVLNGGTHAVARVGDSTSGHVHVEAGAAGPFPVVGSTLPMVDTIANGNTTVLA